MTIECHLGGGFLPDPARPRHPKDKPIFENSVRYVNRFRLTVYAIDGAMKNKPRKPTGTSGVLIVGGGKQRFIRTQYGTSKEEVEDFFRKLRCVPTSVKPSTSLANPSGTGKTFLII